MMISRSAGNWVVEFTSPGHEPPTGDQLRPDPEPVLLRPRRPRIESGSLEASNVNITSELVNMITAQRVYQANAETIKTEDQVQQTLMNLR